MRKLKLQVQLTIDGFVAGVNGEMDWMEHAWSHDLIEFVTKLTNSIDTIVMGKNLAEGFIPHWAAIAGDKNNPEHDAGVRFTATPKFVFSNSLSKTDPKVANWHNTTVVNENLVQFIEHIKAQEGGDIIAYGGAHFVAKLIKENLIDELNLFINPAIIGKGKPIFNEVLQTQNYTLTAANAFECGVAVLTYKKV